MFTPSLLSTLLLAFAAVSATRVATIDKSLITLPISRRVNAMSPGGLYRHDLERAQAFGARGNAGDVGAELTNTNATNMVVSYIAKVKVGEPPTTCKCS